MTANGETFTVVFGSVQIDDGTDENANVIATDILATNGVIHVVDKVLLPPAGN